MSSAADRLRRLRLEAGFKSAVDAARRFGWNENSYLGNENGSAPFSFKKAKDYARAYRVRAQWLYDGSGPMRDSGGLLPILGYVGADPNGQILFAHGQGTGDYAPAPASGSGSPNVVEVKGYSMPDFADDGALIYYAEPVAQPGAEMIGHIIVCETVDGEVLVKRVQRGSEPGLYNLVSLAGPTREDVRLNWAAIITDVVPPLQARRIIQRSLSQAV